MNYQEPLFRPPAEAESLIFQVAYGCPHNRCRFCGMYKRVRYRLRPGEEVLAEIADAGRRYPGPARVFLADGDCMALPFDRLKRYLEALNRAFPALARVGSYANGSSIQNRTDGELAELFGKTEQVEGMIEAVQRAQAAGLRLSVMVLIGLGGRALRQSHIEQTAAALNRMQPRLLSALRFIPIPGLPFPPGFEPVTEQEAVEELHELIGLLKLERTVFRANHTSNPVPLSGRLPQDRERLCRELEYELASGTLDRNGPGILPFEL